MIAITAWLASLVALLTSMAMLKDTSLDRAARAEFRAVVREFLRRPTAITWNAGLRCALAGVVRFFLRAGVLIAIAASAGVSLLLPHQLDLYSAVLRCSLVTFLAMQAPCPWLLWIAKGNRRGGRDSIDQGASGNVHR